MYNQPSDPYGQYNQQPYGQQPNPEQSGYPGYGQQQPNPEQSGYPGYGQQQPNPEQSGYPGYGQQQPYPQTDYGQQQAGYNPYGQQVPPYAQAQPVQYNIQVGVGTAMTPQKDWLTTLLLCIFLGGLGVHRFYTGHVAIGLVQLFTAGGCGIWALVDLILLITNSYTDSYGRPLLKN